MLFCRTNAFSLAGFLTLAFCAMSPASFAEDSSSPSQDFFFQDGDRVVFLGDSLTASRKYGEIVERYTLSTYPNRRVQFINAGMGGDTATGGLNRLEKTVLNHKPTVVTICYGVNDIGWGLYANEKGIQKYLVAMKGIIEKCQAAGVRVVVMTPCPTKMPNSESSDPVILQEMGHRVLAMAKKMGAHPVDLFGGFSEIQHNIRKAGKDAEMPTHAADGIHLSDLGNLAFGYVLLKGLGAPDCISSLDIDAASAKSRDLFRCKVRDLRIKNGSISFTRLDEGWPLHLGPFAGLDFGVIPSHEGLSRYELKASGLNGSDWYAISVEGRPLTTVTLSQLSNGINLAYVTPGPWEQFPPWKVQGAVVDSIVQARSQLASAEIFGSLIMPNNKSFTKRYRKSASGKIEATEDLAYELAKPKPLHFEIVPTSAPQPPAPPTKRKMSEEEIETLKETLNGPWAMKPAREAIEKMLKDQGQ